MTQALRANYANQDEQISTIVSEQVLVPLTCPQCKMDTDVSIATLKQQHPFLCEHCYRLNHLSDTEMEVLMGILERFGYRVKR